MFKETPSSLRRYFALVAFLCLVGSLLSIFFHQKAGPAQSDAAKVATLLNGLAFAYVAVRFGTLIVESPKVIRLLLHLAFWADCIVGISFGRFPSTTSDRFEWVIAAIIYVYLLRSVTRISDNLKGNVPNQSSEPTLSSGTSPAGQEPRLP
jgi:hypothetical protein